MIESKITWHLDNWAVWMRHGKGIGAGWNRYATGGFRSGIQYGRDFDDMVEEADARCAKAVDAILTDMNPAWRVSVWNAHLYAVFRLHPDNDEINRKLLALAYEQARALIGRELERKGIE